MKLLGVIFDQHPSAPKLSKFQIECSKHSLAQTVKETYKAISMLLPFEPRSSRIPTAVSYRLKKCSYESNNWPTNILYTKRPTCFPLRTTATIRTFSSHLEEHLYVEHPPRSIRNDLTRRAMKKYHQDTLKYTNISKIVHPELQPLLLYIKKKRSNFV